MPSREPLRFDRSCFVALNLRKLVEEKCYDTKLRMKLEISEEMYHAEIGKNSRRLNKRALNLPGAGCSASPICAVTVQRRQTAKSRPREVIGGAGFGGLAAEFYSASRCGSR